MPSPRSGDAQKNKVVRLLQTAVGRTRQCWALSGPLSTLRCLHRNHPSRRVMATLIITEKTSQARDLRAALGDRFGQILPPRATCCDWPNPTRSTPAGERWSCVLLKPDGLYPTRPATEGNKPAKLKAIGGRPQDLRPSHPRHRLRPRGSAHRSGDTGASSLSRHRSARPVHRARSQDAAASVRKPQSRTASCARSTRRPWRASSPTRSSTCR